MSALCLFGALCSVNQGLFTSNRQPSGLDLLGQSSDQQYSYDGSPNQSPCPYVFRYIQDSGEWKGEVTLQNIDSQRDTNMRVELTSNTVLPNNNIGTIQLTTSIEESSINVLNNRPLIYRVNFPTQNPVPKVKGIYHNDKLVCSGPGDTGNHIITINLNSVFKAGQYIKPISNQPNYQMPPQAYQPQPQAYQTQPQAYQTQRPAVYQTQPQAYQTQRPAVYSQTPNQQVSQQFSAEDVACGTPVSGMVQSLVFGGNAITRGQFPWLVAFYYAGKGNLEFICGGNLISKSHVITAAHCIEDKQSKNKREPNSGVIYVGKHNLDNWNEQGSQKRGVQRFIIHEEWQPFDIKYDADIAIIVMDQSVEYSQYVRPLCIWEISDNLNDVVGQQGILAGWGLNENNKLNSEYPKSIEVPIVSEGTCLRSHPAILAVSSDRTFCAGGKNGEGPCKGDSGGGLILQRGDKWYLRGLVSSSPRAGKGSCDPNSFAVFTDVAKFSIWIRSNTF